MKITRVFGKIFMNTSTNMKHECEARSVFIGIYNFCLFLLENKKNNVVSYDKGMGQVYLQTSLFKQHQQRVFNEIFYLTLIR